MSCSVMRCHDPPHRAPLRLPRRSAARLHPAYRSSIAFRSVRAAGGLPAARPCFARIACAPARAFAPARFARLVARASQAQGTLLPPVPVGFFRAGGRRSGPRVPLPPVSSYHGFTEVKPIPGIISNSTNKLWLPPRRLHARQHRPCIRVVAPDPDPGPSPSRFGLAGWPEDGPRLRSRGDGCACVRNPTRPVSAASARRCRNMS